MSFNWRYVLDIGLGVILLLVLSIILISVDNLQDSDDTLSNLVDSDLVLLEKIHVLDITMSSAFSLVDDVVKEKKYGKNEVFSIYRNIEQALVEMGDPKLKKSGKAINERLISYFEKRRTLGHERESDYKMLVEHIGKLRKLISQNKLYKKSAQLISWLQDLEINIHRVNRTEPVAIENIVGTVKSAENLSVELVYLLELSHYPDLLPLVQGLGENLEKIVHLLYKGQESDSFQKELYDFKEKFLIKLKQLDAILKDKIVLGSEKYVQHSRAQLKRYVLFSVVAFIFVMLVAWALRLVISKPMNRIVKGLEQIKLGDFEYRFEHKETGDFDVLASTLNEMLQKINQILSENTSLVRTICHDVGNPLFLILVYSSRIASRIEKGEFTLEQIKEWNQKALINSRRIEDLVTLVREITSIESQKKEYKFETFLFAKMFEEVSEIFMERCKDRRVELLIKNELPEGYLFEGNRILLQNNVINNLVSNAIKFSKADTQIEIKATISEGEIVLRVQDQGIGIPDDLLEKLFDRLQPTSRVGVGGEMGTGFGLPLAKICVELHQGTIEVESRSVDRHPDSHGTSFTVRLPIEKSFKEQAQ